jgi:hypothetical protein
MSLVGFQLSVAASNVTESGYATVTITRPSGTTAQAVTISTSNATASAGADYTALSTPVSFAVGQTTRTVNVPILSDSLVEGNELVNLRLSNPTAGATLGARQRAVLTIVDNDAAGELELSAWHYTATETGLSAVLTISRRLGSAGTVSVRISTSDNTASVGADYTALSQVRTFASGVTSQTVTIPIVNDSIAEGIESLNVWLSTPTGGAVLGKTRSAQVLISDND